MNTQSAELNTILPVRQATEAAGSTNDHHRNLCLSPDSRKGVNEAEIGAFALTYHPQVLSGLLSGFLAPARATSFPVQLVAS